MHWSRISCFKMSCFKVLHYYHLLLRCLTCSGEIEKTRWYGTLWKGKFSFSSTWVLQWYFLFFFRKRPHFICSLLCYLSMQENIQTNIKGKNLRSSRTQMFFKIAVLKNFAVLPRKHLCWSLFLIKLQA